MSSKFVGLPKLTVSLYRKFLDYIYGPVSVLILVWLCGPSLSIFGCPSSIAMLSRLQSGCLHILSVTNTVW